MQAALSDTTVLSNFAHTERPDLLRVLFSPLFVPPSVLEELIEGERRALIPKCSWEWLEVVVPAADLLLARMRERGYRSPVRSLRDLPSSPPRRERL
jgi:predicted nucleic acid-binding protein